jgi:myo-inositol-1(or 4)-monophosphatase
MTIPPTLPTATSGATAMDVAWRCAREGGALALSRFGGTHAVSVKGRGNIVTETDVEVELRIKDVLCAEFPEHAVLSEETSSGTDASSGWTWVIDPIDGTKNYSQGVPFWCVNVALCHDGQPVVGLTYDALHDEGFHAEAGGGAHVNGSRVYASGRPDVESSVIGVDLGYDERRGASQIALIGRIFPKVQTVRILGSAALAFAYAAAGRLDLFTHNSVAPWDIAAGIVLVREAGGAVSDRDGGPISITSRGLAAGGRAVHDDFMARYAAPGGAEV